MALWFGVNAKQHHGIETPKSHWSNISKQLFSTVMKLDFHR